MKLSIKSPEIAREILKQGQNNSYTENRRKKRNTNSLSRGQSLRKIKEGESKYQGT